MPFLELFDETLDINSTGNYELSVQASPDGLVFCLLDTIRSKFVLIRAFEPEDNKYFNAAQVSELISKDDFLGRPFRKVSIIMPSPRFTLIPAALYDPGKKDEYFRFNHLVLEDQVIISNKLNDPDAYLIFSVPGQLASVLNQFYPGVLPMHQVKPLLNHISHSRKSFSGNYIHLNIEREFFNLIVFDQSQMKFCNTFSYRSITDIMYFTMNVFRNLGLAQEETVHLSGRTEKYDDLSTNLAMYVRNLKYSWPAGSFTFSYVFNDASLHRYLNLYSSVNCG